MKAHVALVLSILLAACAESTSTPQPVGVPTTGSAENVGRTGKAGSTARFAVVNDRLYALSGTDLLTFSIEDNEQSIPLSRVSIPSDVETIFPYKGSLFFGAQTGLHIYALTDPDSPSEQASYAHPWACDPVIVKDDIAFVTLSSDSRCGMNKNALQILDVAEIDHPQLLDEIAMFAPKGLSIDKEQVFICDGVAGLKVYDAADPHKLRLKEDLLGQQCNDVLAQNGVLIATGREGIWQYSYESEHLELLSILPWNPPSTR